MIKWFKKDRPCWQFVHKQVIRDNWKSIHEHEETLRALLIDSNIEHKEVITHVVNPACPKEWSHVVDLITFVVYTDADAVMSKLVLNDEWICLKGMRPKVKLCCDMYGELYKLPKNKE